LCALCGLWKPRNFFPGNGPGKVRPECRSCYNERRRIPRSNPLIDVKFASMDGNQPYVDVVVDVLFSQDFLRNLSPPRQSTKLPI
jgi:hypothetical protein